MPTEETPLDRRCPVCLDGAADADWGGRGWRAFPCAHQVCTACDALLERCPLCRVDRVGTSGVEQEAVAREAARSLSGFLITAGVPAAEIDVPAVDRLDGPAAVLHVLDGRVQELLASGQAGVLIARDVSGGDAASPLRIGAVINEMRSMRQRITVRLGVQSRLARPPPPPQPPPPFLPPPPLPRLVRLLQRASPRQPEQQASTAARAPRSRRATRRFSPAR